MRNGKTANWRQQHPEPAFRGRTDYPDAPWVAGRPQRYRLLRRDRPFSQWFRPEHASGGGEW